MASKCALTLKLSHPWEDIPAFTEDKLLSDIKLAEQLFNKDVNHKSIEIRTISAKSIQCVLNTNSEKQVNKTNISHFLTHFTRHLLYVKDWQRFSQIRVGMFRIIIESVDETDTVVVYDLSKLSARQGKLVIELDNLTTDFNKKAAELNTEILKLSDVIYSIRKVQQDRTEKIQL